MIYVHLDDRILLALEFSRAIEVQVCMVASRVCHTDAIVRDQLYPTPCPQCSATKVPELPGLSEDSDNTILRCPHGIQTRTAARRRWIQVVSATQV